MHSPDRPHRFFCFVARLALVSCAAISAQAATGYIRVNQVGYESGLPARAYVMTTTAVTKASFVITNSAAKVVLSGSVGGELGTWAKYHVYPIDFTLSKPDTYTISVSGSVSGLGLRVIQMSCRRAQRRGNEVGAIPFVLVKITIVRKRAPATGGRHVRRQRSCVSVHSASAGFCCGGGRLENQSQSCRTSRRKLCGMFFSVPAHEPQAGKSVLAGGRAHF
jgi:hypothetical protein